MVSWSDADTSTKKYTSSGVFLSEIKSMSKEAVSPEK